jgi:hypothetical protein
MDMRDAMGTKDLTRRALEDYAEEVFDVHVVALRIQRAAKAGRTTARVPQERPVDLSGTTAAALLVLHLESLGFATSWDPVRRMEAIPRETPVEWAYCELMVEWHERIFSG